MLGIKPQFLVREASVLNEPSASCFPQYTYREKRTMEK